MDIDQDIALIAAQEKTLRFPRFDASTAWELGGRIKAEAEARKQAVAIDITLAGAPLFYYAMPGTTPSNADWIRRKKNTVMRFHKSSYAVGFDTTKQNTTLEARTGSTHTEFVAAGGAFPIRLAGSDAVLGTITVSGLPQREDHRLVVAALGVFLGIDIAGLQLEP